MKDYRVKICIPCKNNKWQGKIEERHIKAENLNDVIMKSATIDEYKNGARIVEIWEAKYDRYNSYVLIR